MVEGLDKFTEYFKEYNNNYIIIGGTACDQLITNVGLSFRSTKDLDIILIVEALSGEFVQQFWKFINEGGYAQKERSSGRKIYYRFQNPETKGFPGLIELFSRNPGIRIKEESHLTPIPVDEDVLSLSAILLDNDYYNFTIQNSRIMNGIHIADITALICLKAKAYLDLKERRALMQNSDSSDIKKHKLDIIRLASILTNEDIENISSCIKNDLESAVIDIKASPPDGNIIAKGLHLNTGIDIIQIFKQIEKTFHLFS
jgi:hypothetical protein